MGPKDVRDSDYDQGTRDALNRVSVAAKRDGWSPERLVAAANYNLTLGNLSEVERMTRELRVLADAMFDEDAAAKLLDEAAAIDEQVESLRRLPPRDRREYGKGR